MSNKKIQDLPLKSPIDAMKIPTGGFGDYAVTVKTVLDYFLDKYNIVQEDQILELEKNIKLQLDNKANKNDIYTKDEIDSLITLVSGGLSEDIVKNLILLEKLDTELQNKIESVNGKKGKEILLTREDVGVPTDIEIKTFEKEDRFVITEDGGNQRDVNRKTSNYIGKTITPEMFKSDSDIDWTNALTLAINYINENKAECVLDAKIYDVSKPLPTITNPCSIVGKGVMKTWIKASKDFSGDVLSTFDVNFHSGGTTYLDPNSDTIDISQEKSGLKLQGFSIVGDRSTTNKQNGIIHYGLTDNLFINDISVHNMRGVGWGTAFKTNTSNATGIRESLIIGLTVRRCGLQIEDIPAIDYYTDGYDATNAVTFVRLNSIWADGCCVRFKNTSTNTSYGRFIKVLSGMIHGRENTTSNPQTKPALEVSGLWLSCNFDFTEINGVKDNQYAIHVHKGDMSTGARACTFGSTIGAVNGVLIEHGRDITLNCEPLNATGIHLKVGSAVLGNVFVSATTKDIQYADWNIVNEGIPSRIIFKDRGGSFLVSRTSTTKSLAGGLMPSLSDDGLRLALLSNTGSTETTALNVNRYSATNSSGVATELALPQFPNGAVFGFRTSYNDTSNQLYFEVRSGLNCLVTQRTTYNSRKAIAWNTAMPTSDSWRSGDIVYNSTPTILGTSPNKYVINAWQRITTGNEHVLNVDWIEIKTVLSI